MSNLPQSPEEWEEFLGNMSEDELREMFDAEQQLEKRLAEAGPQDDDELHAWIKSELGYDIPRVAVCEDHQAPFDFIADLYFERETAALLMANRGAGKTHGVAILHWINSLWKPGIESVTFGAIETQSFAAYNHLKSWIYDENGDRRPEIINSMMRETNFRNGSKVSVLGSTPECHPPNEAILTLDGYKAISELDSSKDRIASYKRRNNYLTWGSLTGRRGTKEIAHEFEVASRPYNGDMICLSTKEGETHVTPNHKVMISIKPEIRSCWAVYLMRKDNWWRIGKTRAGKVVNRMNEERGDAIWILGIFDNEARALEMEAIYQARYGISGVCFAPYKHSNARINNPGLIHSALAPESSGRAQKLLEDFNMSPVHPYATRNDGLTGRVLTSGQGWIIQRAANVVPLAGYFDLPTAPSDFATGGRSEVVPSRELASVSVYKYNGDVYSLEVYPHHTYVANGIVVHNSVNSPHPQVAHADEIELMRDDTFKESRNMTQGAKLRDGRFVKPQDIMTSTRKGPNGRMQQLIDEIEQAQSKGLKPPRKLYSYCIFENAQQNKSCRVANPDLPEEQKCECNKYAKGEWDDGSTRTLEDVCGGKFYKSRGWQPFDNVVKQFIENDRETFEVQQLCAKPEMKFHYLPNFSEERYGIRNYKPHPELGPIFMGVDWGGTNPHAVSWYQVLKFDVEVEDYYRNPVLLKQGTIVCFDEIYIAEVSNEKLGQMVLHRETQYKRKFPMFRVEERFTDPAGKAARIAWKDMGLQTHWHITREFDEHIKQIKSLFEDDMFRVDVDRCPQLIREAKKWRRDERTGNQLDEDNHQMSAMRYALVNINRVKKKFSGTGTAPVSSTIPRQAGRVRITRTGGTSPLGFKGRNNEFDNWRKSLGSPVTRERH